MLVICNGGPKGGSTWITSIARSLRNLSRVPKKYQDQRYIHSSIEYALLPDFLRTEDIVNKSFYSKQHWGPNKWRRNLLVRNDIKILNIIRDIRDVTVSRYYHDLKYSGIEQTDFENYYWRYGRTESKKYAAYQVAWHTHNVEPFLVSFELLKFEQNESIRRIADYLKVADPDYDTVRAATSFSTKQLKNGNSFYRKSAVGEWRTHFSDRIAEDLKDIVDQSGFRKLMIDLDSRDDLLLPPDLLTGQW